MSLVEKDDMTTLRSASDSRATADTAERDIQLKAIAYAINSAANTGEKRVIFQEKLVDGVKEELESKGYILRFVNNNAYHLQNQLLISWDENATKIDEPSNSGPKYNSMRMDIEPEA